MVISFSFTSVTLSVAHHTELRRVAPMRPCPIIEQNLGINIVSAKGQIIKRDTNSYVPGVDRVRAESITVAPYSRMNLHEL